MIDRFFNILLFFIPIAAAMGPYASIIDMGGINLFLFRIIIIVSILFSIIAYGKIYFFKYRSYAYLSIIFLFWIIWGLASTFWAIDEAAALKESFIVLFGFATFVALVQLGADRDAGVRWLVRGWVLAIIVTGAIAVWELATGQHLPGGWVSEQPDYVTQFVAISTFENPNNYGAFLLLSLPISIYYYELSISNYRKIYLIFMIFMIIVISFMTLSKVATLGILIVVALYLLGRLYKTGFVTKLIVISILIASFFSLPIVFQNLEGSIPVIAEINQLYEAGIQSAGSNRIRINLTIAGIRMLQESLGFGVGAGNFPAYMAAGRVDLWTSGMNNPHNWWIEILSQYGLVVFLLFVGYLVYIYKKSSQILNYANYNMSGSVFIRLSLVSYVLAGFANSSYIAQSTNWLFIGTLVVIFANLNSGTRDSRKTNRGAVWE